MNVYSHADFAGEFCVSDLNAETQRTQTSAQEKRLPLIPAKLRSLCCSAFKLGTVMGTCVLVATTVGAAEAASAEATRTTLPDPGASLLRVMGALVGVIAIFFGFVWLFRNWQRFLVQRGRAPKLNMLEVRSLGGRHSVYVIGYEQDRFLVGASPNGLNLLTHLPQATEEAATASSETVPVSIPFSQALAQVLKGK